MFEHFLNPNFSYWEQGIYKEVITDDVYGLKKRLFRNDEVVMDVGAHVGWFSALALNRGTGHVIAIEASPQNCRRLRLNLSQWKDRVTIVGKALWRSDRPEQTLAIAEILDSDKTTNTGGGNVICGSRTVPVKSVTLDELVGDQIISLLKIDCEGSEYPCFYTTKVLPRIKEIVGELHTFDGLFQPQDDVKPGFNNPKAMASFLEENNFKVELMIRPECTALAYIRAINCV